MPYRNKTYLAFDGDTDIHYYRLMKAWKQNDDFDFNFHDAHDLNSAYDWSQEESIKAQLAERMRNSKLFILLVGEHTKALRKFVPWEIEQAIKRNLPVIVVNLNGNRGIDYNRCPNTLLNSLSIHVSYSPSIIQYAMDKWPQWHAQHQVNGNKGPRYYEESTYKMFELWFFNTKHSQRKTKP
jgi:hypothetical protein